MGAQKRKSLDEVLAEELVHIRRRRAIDGRTDDDPAVGLAFSGGGIRSATFGLGVLESLKARGLLSKVDYLSTVSGGGYIGAWLSANCRRAAQRRLQPKNCPSDQDGKATYAAASRDWLSPAADWQQSVAHLRRYSNYLSPTIGFFSADTWTMATIWLRNALLVQVTLFFAIAALLLVPRLMFPVFTGWPAQEGLRWITVALFALAIAGIAANQLRVCCDRDIPFLKAEAWPVGLLAGGICFGIAWRIAASAQFTPFTDCPQDWRIAFAVAFAIVIGAFCLMPVAVRLLALFWIGRQPPPLRINFTQGWTQWLVILPLLLTGFFVAAVLWGQATGHHACKPGLADVQGFGELASSALNFWPFPLAIAFVSLWLLAFCAVMRRGVNWKGILAALLAPLPAILVLHLTLCAIMLLLRHWALSADGSGSWQAFIWAPALVLFAFSLAIVMLIGMLGRQAGEGMREWWSRLGAWLNIYGMGWLAIALVAVFGPLWTSQLLQAGTWASNSLLGGWLAATLSGLFAGKSARSNGANGNATTLTSKGLELAAMLAPFVFIAGLLIGIATLLHLLIGNLASNAFPASMAEIHKGHWEWMTPTREPTEQFAKLGLCGLLAWLLGGCLACLGLLASRVDINVFSLNNFYRNRLARCYLGAARHLPGERQPQNFTGFDNADDLPLAEMALSPNQAPPGPLHIVNCALNLGGTSDLSMHTRHSASFILTPYVCGSNYPVEDRPGQRSPMGYLATASYGGHDGQPTLGQAISVSGAAASPNMGYHTSPVVAFLLTVFNVRLGWWFPNPREGARFPSPWFSLHYLLKELFGGADERSRYLMISDGGHFENLAAYELVRRRCRIILISDAECDPAGAFEGLGNLIRICATDHRAEIDIDVSAIRAGRARHAIGRIRYGDGTSGTLIYLKASLNGTEDTSVVQYKAKHPAFPHETTADQFYGEDQFESYRRLGRSISDEAFAGARDWMNIPAGAGDSPQARSKKPLRRRQRPAGLHGEGTGRLRLRP